MASLIKGLRLAQHISKNSSILVTASRTAAHWNKDFKPGPFPKTQEERDAAAKKYNLLPEEYRPYADEGLYYGDYPHLPEGPGGLGIEAKDNYYPYDFPEHKRNFNEPLHAQIDLIGEDRYSQPEKTRFENWQYFASFFGFMTCCFVLYYWLEDKKMFRPVLPKQYPRDGKVHYTFEPKN
ncbi:NADH dehydrogenase [ubiquinone] 1 beta subcomplex subunit 8, mitochondrial [Episyrphus balteatus]|uniref:NADH dehydrogenase [ubiquinone] 1 beta subcomplex subunit 8, mitochondrial n=1 Tax=Episyrphus balteatus TaxID=286459 RepID=UPI00248612D6|nr:NADH dehydrogenase [ubiquinone] 1 beta subcomplex subunit 8, mitochondrial [Episyrphus balteatus]